MAVVEQHFLHQYVHCQMECYCWAVSEQKIRGEKKAGVSEYMEGKVERDIRLAGRMSLNIQAVRMARGSMMKN
jgi:hypothetical protein